jgi:hypothetical protein
MEPTEKVKLRDVLSHAGHDYVVEGLLTYQVGNKSHRFARAQAGKDVVLFELLSGELDDRLLLLRDVHDLALTPPPPPSIHYRQASFVSRWSGLATISLEGNGGERAGGSCEVWRYRAGGDLVLQIEKWGSTLRVLSGESVPKGLIEHYPSGS